MASSSKSPSFEASSLRNGAISIARLFPLTLPLSPPTQQYGRTPLHCAADRGCVDVILVLLDRGADLEAVDKHGLTPLHGAAFKGNSGAVSALLDHGANIDAVDDGGATPLSLACSPGVVALLRARAGRSGAPAAAARRF